MAFLSSLQSKQPMRNCTILFFLDDVETDGLWPSCIRVDRGVENVLVCDVMVYARLQVEAASLLALPPTAKD